MTYTHTRTNALNGTLAHRDGIIIDSIITSLYAHLWPATRGFDCERRVRGDVAACETCSQTVRRHATTMIIFDGTYTSGVGADRCKTENGSCIRRLVHTAVVGEMRREPQDTEGRGAREAVFAQ